MRKKQAIKLILAFLVIVGVAAAAGAGVTWWGMSAKDEKKEVPAEKLADGSAQRYVSLEKVIVMLRRNSDDTAQHYLGADFVFKTSEDKEKLLKAHLPLLRSEAVKFLSGYTKDVAEAMTISQVAAEIDRALTARYTRDRQAKPFSEVMVGKLIIE